MHGNRSSDRKLRGVESGEGNLSLVRKGFNIFLILVDRNGALLCILGIDYDLKRPNSDKTRTKNNNKRCLCEIYVL